MGKAVSFKAKKQTAIGRELLGIMLPVTKFGAADRSEWSSTLHYLFLCTLKFLTLC